VAQLFADKYHLEAQLGQGGMCEVYRARQLMFDRQVAIKILRRTLAVSAESRARFMREARNCARLDHPAIVTVYDVDEFEGRPYIAMQYIDGGSLNDLLDEGLNTHRGIRLLAEVAEALACAHAADLTHRDLKPENILICSDDHVKVADWGLAKALDGAQNLTHAGVVLGTPEYMSPEQIMSQPLGRKSDLYALGVMLFEVLTGQLPFRADTGTELLQAHIYHAPRQVRALAPHVPSVCAELAEQLLAKSPDDRPESAAAVARRLVEICDECRDQLIGYSTGRSETPTSRTSDAAAPHRRSTRKNAQPPPAAGHPTIRVLSKPARVALAIVVMAVIGCLLYWRFSTRGIP